ncbi:MAG: hypothetical protein ACM3Y8_10265 [Byssovorax cruenta]
MPTPTPNSNEPSRFRRILNASEEDSVTSRLPRARVKPTYETNPLDIAPVSKETVYVEPRYRFLPAFWTIASSISLLVNIVLFALVIILLRMLGSVQALGTDKASGLLADLYSSFAAMDSATISRVVPVDANIPLNITVPVNLNEQKIVLAQPARIEGVGVQIYGGDITVDTRRAIITLPAGTPLTVNLGFNLPVQNSVPVHIDVPVKIPLNETELHAPFTRLRQTVQPYYCLLQPQAFYAGVQVCP